MIVLSSLLATASNLEVMASNLPAMASNLVAVASTPVAMATNLVAIAGDCSFQSSGIMSLQTFQKGLDNGECKVVENASNHPGFQALIFLFKSANQVYTPESLHFGLK